MAYDPFARGPLPVGVRSTAFVDASRDDRRIPVELWYPADDAHRGADLTSGSRDTYELLPGLMPVEQDAVRDARPRAGRFPLLVFSHGYGGHRRQSTFLCTHLASHGYVVAACDHPGNTMLDVIRLRSETRRNLRGLLDRLVALRPGDVEFTIDAVLADALGPLVDAERIAVAGHSFGGWTTLAVAGREPRVRAALALAPAGGAGPLAAAPLREALTLAAGRDVPTLFVAADRDSLLPLPGVRELFAGTVATRKRLVVLENTDHMHFCDRAEQVHSLLRMLPPAGFEAVASTVPPIEELAPPAHAYLAVSGLATAHLDASLTGHPTAAAVLDDAVAALAAHGVRVSAH